MTDDPPKFVPHDCKLCPKRGLIGPHYLAHLRFKHPLQYENWIRSRADFGMSGFLHFNIKLEEDRIPV